MVENFPTVEAREHFENIPIFAGGSGKPTRARIHPRPPLKTRIVWIENFHT